MEKIHDKSEDASHIVAYEFDEAKEADANDELVGKLSSTVVDARRLVMLSKGVWKTKFDVGAVDFDDSISTNVSSCECNIFCGNIRNLVANTLFVEKQVLEFNVLDVCFDGAKGLKVENGINDLVVCDNEGLKHCCSRDFLEMPKFLNGGWSCATLRFGGDIGVQVFDPGAFDVRVRSMSPVAIFMVLDHGKWNVAYCEQGIRLGICAAQIQQLAQLCDQLVLVIEKRTGNNVRYMIGVLEIDEEGHFLVFHITNFHFTMSFLPGWWPSMGAKVDRGVTAASTEYRLDDCPDTKVLGLEAFWFKERMQPSSQSDVSENGEDYMITQILRFFIVILTSTLRARWFSTVGELIGI